MGSHQSRPSSSTEPHQINSGASAPTNRGRIMSQEEESGNGEASGSSGYAGRKRRSRFSTASTAIMNPNTAETPETNASDSSNATTSESTSNDMPMRERERRASRMLAQLREGFRRSASSRSVPALAGPSKLPSDGNASGRETMGMAIDQSEGLEEGMHTAKASDKVRQDKKRRRIGEYAGPSEAMDAGGVEDLSVDASESSC